MSSSFFSSLENEANPQLNLPRRAGSREYPTDVIGEIRPPRTCVQHSSTTAIWRYLSNSVSQWRQRISEFGVIPEANQLKMQPVLLGQHRSALATVVPIRFRGARIQGWEEMGPQTERQITVTQNSGPGLQKNCQSPSRRRILKTRNTKGLAVRRSTSVLGKPNSSALAIPSENRFELECFASSPASCLTQPQNGLDRADTKTPCANRPVPTEEFAAPQMRRIFRTAYRITRNREDAEDAVQDACLQAIVHVQEFDGRSKFSTWLTRIAINSSLMILRKQRTAKLVPLHNPPDFKEAREIREVTDPEPDAERRYLQQEKKAALWNEINVLRPTLKDIVELAQLREYSLRETAEIAGLSVAAVKARLFHARQALRNSSKLRQFSSEAVTKQT